MSIKLLKNEFRKNFNLKQFIIIVLLMALMNVAGIFICENQPLNNWRNYAIEKREEYLSYIEDDDNEDITATFEEEIVLIDYSLENDIPYGTTGIWKHLSKMTGLFSVIIIIVIYMNSKIFLNEYECNTWKNLFCTQATRNRIFMGKAIYCLFQIIIYLMFYMLAGIICGVTFGTGHGIVELSVQGGQVVETNLMVYIMVSYGITLLQMIFYVSVAITTILLIKEKKLAIILPIMIMLISSMLNQWIGDNAVANFLPFKYLVSVSEVSLNSIIKATIILLGYSSIFFVISSIRLKKIEIK